MKKTTKKIVKCNAKRTKIKCLRCNEPFIAERNTAKCCSALCRVQESNFRKENGFLNSVFSGTFNELKNNLNTSDFTKLLYGFDDDLDDIKDLIDRKKLDLPWKYSFKDYMIYHIPHIKKKPFELYYNDSKLEKYTKFKSTYPSFVYPKIIGIKK